MKSKKPLIISSILIAVGLVICIIAFAISGLKTFGYKTRYGNIGIGHHNGHYSMGAYISDDENIINNSEIKKLENFNKLNINLNYADLRIKQSENEEFKLEVNYKNNNSKISYSVKNNTLIIEDAYYHKAKHKNRRNEIIVYIPNNVEIEKLNSYCDYGETNIDNLNATNIDIENNMGSINITNSNLTNSEISLDMGEFIATNTVFSNLNLESSMGAAEIEGQVLGRNEISMDMGSLTLKLNQVKEDTKLIAEADLGSITIDGTTSSGISSEQIINPSGTNSIELEASLGSIEISFK